MSNLRLLFWVVSVTAMVLFSSCGETTLIGGGAVIGGGSDENSRDVQGAGRNDAGGTIDAGDATEGATAGDGTGGSGTAGTGSAGDATAGDATAGDATAGDATAGDATAGDATAGDAGGDKEVVALVIDPTSTNVFTGQTFTFIATATYADQSTADVTGQAVFASSNTAILDLHTENDAVGSVIGKSPGAAEVTATLGGVTATANVIVLQDAIQSLTLEPANLTLPLEANFQFIATAQYPFRGAVDVTETAAWSVSSADLGSVERGRFVAGSSAGTVNVIAALEGATAEAVVILRDINPDSLVVEPVDHVLPQGETIQYKAALIYPGNLKVDVTALASWSVIQDKTDIAAFEDNENNPGLLSAKSAGLVALLASYKGKTRQVSLRVTGEEMIALKLVPAALELPVGVIGNVQAVAQFSNGSEVDVSANAVFATDNDAVASFDSATPGSVQAKSVGSAAMTATYNGMEAAGTITVNEAKLRTLIADPQSISVPVGMSQSLKVFGEFDNGERYDYTAQVTYNVADPTIGQVLSAGSPNVSFKGLAVGETTVKVAFGGISLTIPAATTDAVLDRVEVDPALAELGARTSQPFRAYAVFSDGVRLEITEQAVWTSQNEAVAKVANIGNTSGGANVVPGLVTAFTAGVAVIQAKYAGKKGQATVTVTENPIYEPSLTLAVNGDQSAEQTHPKKAALIGTVNAEHVSKCKLEVNGSEIGMSDQVSAEGSLVLTAPFTMPDSLDNPLVIKVICYGQQVWQEPVSKEITITPTVPVIENLLVNGKAERVYLLAGSLYTVTWSSLYADRCELWQTEGDSPVKVADQSGYQATLASGDPQDTYRLDCYDRADNKTSATIAVEASTSVVDLFIEGSPTSQSFPQGKDLTITWATENVVDCALTINGDSVDMNGGSVLHALGPDNATVRLACKSTDAGTEIAVTLIATSTLPTVTLFANDADVPEYRGDHGSTVTFRYEAQYTESCELKVGNTTVQGNPYNHGIDGNVAVTVTCSDSEGNQDTDTVNVIDVPIAVRLLLTEDDPSVELKTELDLAETRQYHAALEMSDGSIIQLSANEVTFATTDATIVGMGADGRATGEGVGTATISAEYQTFEPAILDLTVVPRSETLTFDVDTNPGKIDLVWVVDNSGSMADNIEVVKNNLESFLAYIEDRSDINFILLSQNDCEGYGACAPVTLPDAYSSTPRVNMFINSSDALIETAVALCPADDFNFVTEMVDNDNKELPICGSSEDHRITSSGPVLPRELQNNKGALNSMLRPEAKKAFVFVTDDRLRSQDDGVLQVDDSTFVDLIQDTIGEFEPAIFGITGVEEADDCQVGPEVGKALAGIGPSLWNLAEDTGGSIYDICDLKREADDNNAGEVTFFESLSKELVVVANSDFVLADDLGEIIAIEITQVNRHGDEVEITDYELEGNVVHIRPAAIDAEGGAVQITYSYIPN